MDKGRKEQFMALVDPKMLARLDALRVVMWTSRAEVNRQALDMVMETMESENAEDLGRLEEVASRAGMSRKDFVKGLVAGRQRVPSLDDLEKYTKTQLRALLK